MRTIGESSADNTNKQFAILKIGIEEIFWKKSPDYKKHFDKELMNSKLVTENSK